MPRTLPDKNAANLTPDFLLLQDLVGSAAFRHERQPFHDGHIHFIRLDPFMAESRVKQVHDRVLNTLRSSLPPTWTVLPGSPLLACPRQIAVIVPSDYPSTRVEVAAMA
jgi:hypothetical protein